jgi:predicted transcriptional regulator
LVLTATLTAAYISRNAVTPSHIATVIGQIHSALKSLQLAAMPDAALQHPTNLEIDASIKYDRLISFIDGKAYKSLKRHLTAHGMTPEDYRARYSLPSDYPMVSPGYATVRSRIARRAYSRFEVT